MAIALDANTLGKFAKKTNVLLYPFIYILGISLSFVVKVSVKYANTRTPIMFFTLPRWLIFNIVTFLQKGKAIRIIAIGHPSLRDCVIVNSYKI